MNSDIKLVDENVIIEGVLCVQEIAGVNNQVKLTGYDLLLDNIDRRTPGSDPNLPRRALVHDDGDRLTVNYAGDYPGGVGIQGPVVIQGSVAIQGPLDIQGTMAIQAIQGEVEIGEITATNKQLKIKGYDLILDEETRRKPGSNPNQPRRALVHDVGDRLTVNYGEDYPGGVAIQGPVEIGAITTGASKQLKIKGYDLILDEGSRRQHGSNPKHPRRALVHDVGDRLTVNYGEDYPGGVAIQGPVEIGEITTGASKQLKIKGYDLILDEETRRKPGSNPQHPRRALVHDVDDRLSINYAKDYPGGVTINGPVHIEEIAPFSGKLNVAGELVVSNANPAGAINSTHETMLDIKNDTILVKAKRKSGSTWKEVVVLDLVQAVRDLQARVQTLEEEVAKLKNPK